MKNKLQVEDYYILATDASVSGDKVGCAVHDVDQNISYLFCVGGVFTSTFGEIMALKQAILLAKKIKLTKICIFTDSLAAINALDCTHTNNFLVAETYNELYNSNIEEAKFIWAT